MQVREVMSSSFTTIEAKSTLVEAFETAEDRNLGALLVMASGQVSGVVTSQDIARQCVSDEKAASEKQVREVMSRKIASCYADTDVHKARAFVRERGFHHLLVCNRDKQVIGLLSASDLEQETRSQE